MTVLIEQHSNQDDDFTVTGEHVWVNYPLLTADRLGTVVDL